MEDRTEVAMNIKGTNYRLQTSIKQACCFSVMLYDDDTPDRWSGDFTADYVQAITTKAGAQRSLQVFWKMMQCAIAGTSDEVSLTLLSEGEFRRMCAESQNKCSLSSAMFTSVEHMYVCIEHNTTFSSAKYPLKLKRQPYTHEELCAMIRALKGENRRLQANQAQAGQSELVQSLETQIYEMNRILKKVEKEKDDEIQYLKTKISDMEKKQAKANRVNRSFRAEPVRSRPAPRQTATAAGKRNSSIGRTSSERRQPARPRYGINSRNSSASGSARSSAAGSRRSSAQSSRRSSAVGSARSSAAGSARSSAAGSRSSSRCSNGSFKRFDPTEWVKNRKSGNSSRNSSRNQSPAAGRPRKAPARNPSFRAENSNSDNMQRIRALIQRKYKY